MKTEQEIKVMVQEIEENFKHVLTGSVATVWCNAPRALEQMAAQTKLDVLYWMLGKKYKSKLKGVDL